MPVMPVMPVIPVIQVILPLPLTLNLVQMSSQVQMKLHSTAYRLTRLPADASPPIYLVLQASMLTRPTATRPTTYTTTQPTANNLL